MKIHAKRSPLKSGQSTKGGSHGIIFKQVLQAIVFRCSSCYCWFSHDVIKIQAT